MGWEGGRFLILFKSGGCRVSQRFHFFYVNQGNKEGQDWFEIFCMTPCSFHMKITASITKASIKIVAHAIYSYQLFSFTYILLYFVAE